ncbi:DUF2145 domain-containing protein [Sedimenticola thiotaurini]|uniref:DUF2145 domain-containing protein n=1 Tax=Sedimenticola thiotaurini TaxID=1543721 RepID=A0A0F7K0K7_9GAMM|nr:DUF2145 domain-containing protein [Sedimenticola thiotaurini]AKH20548.1 hypothetical protein AAY24_09490 [Sedimenticola thiotaurini]
MKTNILKAILIGLIMTATGNVQANSSAAGTASIFTPQQVSAFAKKVEQTLAEKGARVFLISRVGIPEEELPKGINYTHTALAVYSEITTEDGNKAPGYAIYNLYQRDGQPDVSELVVDFPVDFFSSAHVMKAGIVIPVPKLQERLLRVIRSKTYSNLHNPNYSVLANPFKQKFQNCTGFVLNVLNAAIYQTDDIEVIKANTRAYFKPQRVDVGGFKLLLGSMFKPDIALSDHQGPVVTTTFGTITKYLEEYSLSQEHFTLTADTQTAGGPEQPGRHQVNSSDST